MKVPNDKIKKALQPTVPEWNDELVWNNIEEALPKKKKRRFLLLFLSLALSVLSFSVWLYKSNQSAITSQTSSSSKPAIKKERQLSQENESLSTTIKTTSQNSELATYNKQKNKNNKVSTSKSNTSTPSSQSSNIQDVSTPHSFNFNLSKYNHPAPIKNTPTSQKSIVNRIEAIKLEFLTAQDPKLLRYKKYLPVLNLRSPYLVAEMNPSKELSKANALSFWIKSEILFTDRSLKTNNEKKWASLNESYNKPAETMSYSLGLNKEINKTISISAGIGYRQTVELFEFSDSLISNQVIQSDSAIVVNGLNQLQYFSGELNQTTIQKRTVRKPNRYQRIYLPLNFNFCLPLRSGSLSIGTGFNLDIYSNYDGYLVDQDQVLITDNATVNRWYNSKISISELNLTFNYDWQINDKWTAFAGAQYNRGIKNHMDFADIQLRYSFLGLNTGISLKF